MFPIGLYGTKRDVKLFANRLAREGARKGSWRDELMATRHESVLDMPGDIFVSDKSKWYSEKAELWRINLLQISLKEATFKWARPGTYEALVHEMLDRMWFCVATLSPDAWNGPCGFAGEGELGDWSKFVLGSMVKWLPELNFIGYRISNMTHASLAISLSSIPFYRYQWGVGILKLCAVLGQAINIPYDVEDDQWNLFRELERMKLIAIEVGRCKLTI